jgi:hypothetical protein
LESFSVYRYRNNIQLSLNIYNNYNYVTSRRSNQAVVLYNSRRSNGYERQHPDYAFSRRNATVSNRYELEQRRNNKNVTSRNSNGYSNTRTTPSREAEIGRNGNQRDYSQNRTNPSRQTAPQTATQRDNSQNRAFSSRESGPQRNESQRNYSQTRTNSSRTNCSSKNRNAETILKIGKIFQRSYATKTRNSEKTPKTEGIK